MHEDQRGHAYVYLPPWDGPIRSPAVPDENGNFLHYTNPKDPRFQAAHTFASIRFTLDIWEKYYGKTIEWYFRDYFDQAEIVIIPQFENAQIGRGFIEIGTDINKKNGTLSPFSLNFDVIAHEVGHGLLFSEVGEPDVGHETAEYLGFQESSADLVSMIAIMHFDSVIDEVLESTSGNLYMANNLNRFAETSPVEQIRMAANNMKLSDFSLGWTDSHRLAQPMTGAVFDILVDIFHEELVRVGAISTSLEELSDALEGSAEYGAQLQHKFENAYQKNKQLFRQSLLYARDAMASLLIDTWAQLSPNDFYYTDVHHAMMASDRALFDGNYHQIIDVNFGWREIGSTQVGPQLPKKKDEEPGYRGHKDKKHTIDGINENIVPLASHPTVKKVAGSFKTRKRKCYAERYREARATLRSSGVN
jgi:hypothetical protein